PFRKTLSKIAPPPRAEGQANPDLARSLADHIRQQAVNSDGGQKHRQSSESAHQIGGETTRGNRPIEDVIHGRNTEYRQARINALDFTPDLWFEQARGQRRPQHHAQSLGGVLIGRDVDMWSAIDIETIALDVPDDAHD